MDDLERLAEEIRDAETVVAMTGAGISAPSGVPTFRGDDGIWDRFEEGQFEYGRFRRDPDGFWRDRLELEEAMYGDEEYRPNAGHEALARMDAAGELSAIVTQNVDGLHQRAAHAVTDGGEDDDVGDVIELHGNSRRVVCTECGRREDADDVTRRVREGACPPRCGCGGLLKPDVVLFGERLPAVALQRARSLADESEVFLAVGSSLVVEPAASLPRTAANRGASVAVVNLEPTPRDPEASYVFREGVTEVLPRLRELVLEA